MDYSHQQPPPFQYYPISKQVGPDTLTEVSEHSEYIPIKPKFDYHKPTIGAPPGYSKKPNPIITKAPQSSIPQPYQMHPSITVGGYAANPYCLKCHGTGVTYHGKMCTNCFHQ